MSLTSYDPHVYDVNGSKEITTLKRLWQWLRVPVQWNSAELTEDCTSRVMWRKSETYFLSIFAENNLKMNYYRIFTPLGSHKELKNYWKTVKLCPQYHIQKQYYPPFNCQWLLVPCNWKLLNHLKILQIVKIIPALYEIERSYPYVQQPTVKTYPEANPVQNISHSTVWNPMDSYYPQYT